MAFLNGLENFHYNELNGELILPLIY